MINSCFPYSIALPSVYQEALSYGEVQCILFNKIETIEKLLNGQIDKIMSDWLFQNFNELMLNASYNQETETIILNNKSVG
jgi:hypothetical protein